MSKRFYITGIENKAGKSFLSLGILTCLKQHYLDLRCFKLFSENENDQLAILEALTGETIKPLMPIAKAISMTQDAGDELLNCILNKLPPLDKQACYFEGSDFESDNTIFEYEFNVRLAYQLGCELILIISGKDRDANHILSLIQTALDISKKNHAQVVSVIINRVSVQQEQSLKALLQHKLSLPFLLVPEFEQLVYPSVKEVAAKLNAQIICGQEELTRQVKQITVAAKTIGNFLTSRLDRQGMLIITPSDRTDVLLGTLLADKSANYPKIAGIVLTGGEAPPPLILDIVSGVERPFPVLLTEAATYETATTLYSAKYHLNCEDMAKVYTSIQLMSPYIFASLEKLLQTTSKNAYLNPALFLYELINKAQAAHKHIVLPEGEDERILQAADYLLKRKIVKITLLGNKEKIMHLTKKMQLDLPHVHIIEIEKAPQRERYAQKYLELRQHKNVNASIAQERMTDVNYFAVMMVYFGDADGVVSGAQHTTADTVRPALEIIKTKPGLSKVSSVFLMCLPTRVLIYGDCAINPDPDSQMLMEISFQAVAISKRLGLEPRVALLSYSSGSSGKGESVEKVCKAMDFIKEKDPTLLAEGPLQYDAAVDPAIAKRKLPHSRVAGRANILIFPDLNTGNNTYKAVQRETGALAIGPVLLGLNKPVNDLSRGCTYQDIIHTILITAIQAGDDDVNSHA